MYSPTVVPSAKLTAKADDLLHIIKVAAVDAAPLAVIVTEENAALVISIEPVPFAASLIPMLVEPPEAVIVGSLLFAAFASVISFTAELVAVTFINSLPLVSFNDVPTLPVFITGLVSVLFARVTA